MLRTPVVIAALIVFVICARKFGFKDTLTWAALLVLSVFPFSLGAGLIARPAHWLWSLLPMKARIVTISTFTVVIAASAKEKGWGKTIAWVFAWGLFGCALVFGFFFPILVALMAKEAH